MDEVVRAHGHEHISARHASTLELTEENYLTPAGDCILGIEADRTPTDFDAEFTDACRDDHGDVRSRWLHRNDSWTWPLGPRIYKLSEYGLSNERVR